MAVFDVLRGMSVRFLVFFFVCLEVAPFNPHVIYLCFGMSHWRKSEPHPDGTSSVLKRFTDLTLLVARGVVKEIERVA